MNDKENFRAGFVSFVGRPNVGKSSLVNALVGQKIAITSDRPQTTRKTIRAILTRPESQIIFVDTPGVHRPRTLLGERLNDLTREALSGVDIIGFCIPANEKIGPGDRFIIDQISQFKHAKKIAIVTKIDTLKRDAVTNQLAEVDQLFNWDAVIPVATDNAEQLQELSHVLSQMLPESFQLYGDDEVTEETLEEMYAELIREAALEDVREELPHSLAVTIEDQVQRDDGVLEIYANLIVERDSQKGIIIGKGGSQLKAIGSKARREIEDLLGHKIYLSLNVKVLKDWQKNPKFLGRLGF